MFNCSSTEPLLPFSFCSPPLITNGILWPMTLVQDQNTPSHYKKPGDPQCGVGLAVKTMGWRDRRGELVTVSLGCSLNCWFSPLLPLACHKRFSLPHFLNGFSVWLFCPPALFLNVSLFLSAPPVYPPSTPSYSLSLSLPPFPTHTLATLRPDMNFWQELGSLFNCQCYCECPRKSNAVMPLKRLLGHANSLSLALSLTHIIHFSFSPTSSLFMHTLAHAQSNAQMWRVRTRALRLFVLTLTRLQLQFLFAISTGASPVHQTHGNWRISILSKGFWAAKECNGVAFISVF